MCGCLLFVCLTNADRHTENDSHGTHADYWISAPISIYRIYIYRFIKWFLFRFPFNTFSARSQSKMLNKNTLLLHDIQLFFSVSMCFRVHRKAIPSIGNSYCDLVDSRILRFFFFCFFSQVLFHSAKVGSYAIHPLLFIRFTINWFHWIAIDASFDHIFRLTHSHKYLFSNFCVIFLLFVLFFFLMGGENRATFLCS